VNVREVRLVGVRNRRKAEQGDNGARFMKTPDLLRCLTRRSAEPVAGFEFGTCLNFGRGSIAKALALTQTFFVIFPSLSPRCPVERRRTPLRSASFRSPCDRFFFAFFFASMAASLRVPSEFAPNIFPDSRRIERRPDNNVFQGGRGRGNKSRTVTIEYLITRLRVTSTEISRSHLTLIQHRQQWKDRCVA